MGKKLGDYVQDGNEKELKRNFDKIIKKTRFINRWCSKNIERTERSVIFINLLSSVADYLEIARDSIGSHISILALVTRSQYELNLRLRSMLESDEEQKRWASESITDKVQTLEGILLLKTESTNYQERDILNQEIDRLKKLRIKYGLPDVKRPAGALDVARSINLEDEHKALFKLFSKLVHPSSYLVNDYDNAASVEIQKILQIHAQLYAHDSISRVCDILSVPLDISKPYGQA